MKKLERILLVIYLLCFLFQTVDYKGSDELFWLATAAISLYYLIASYWRFKPRNRVQGIIAIVSGIVLSLAIYSIWYNIRLLNEPLYDKYFPVPIIVVFIILLILVFIKRKETSTVKYYRPILLRLLVVVLISSLFAYGNPRYDYYRSIIIALNADSPYIKSNMRMFGYVEKAEDYLENSLCSEALNMSTKALKEGENWLEIKLRHDMPKVEKDEIWKIHGVITTAYKAYSCLGEKALDDGDNQKALDYFFIADSILHVIPNEEYEYWKQKRADSKNDIGRAYYRLNIPDSAINYYTKAIEHYQKKIGKEDKKLAAYISNAALVAMDEYFYEQAIHLYNTSINILKKDSFQNEEIGRLYLKLIRYGLLNSKYSFTDSLLKKSVQYLNTEQQCEHKLYSGILLHNKNLFNPAIQEINQALTCFTNEYNDKHQNVAQTHIALFESYKVKANYKAAWDHLTKAFEISELKYPEGSYNHLPLVQKKAELFNLMGKYNNAKKLYKKIVDDLPNLKNTDDNVKFITALIYLSQLNSDFGEIDDALININKAIELINSSIDIEQSEGMLNAVSNVLVDLNRIEFADSLYNHVIEIATTKGLENDLNIATAYNGLGLINYSQKQYKEASKFYNRSLAIYHQIFNNNHPHIGIILLNKAHLLAASNEHEEAIKLLNEGLNIYQSFHDNTHPDLADFHIMRADILLKEKDSVNALIYLEKALEILEETFDQDHSKIKQIHRLIKKIRAARS